MYRIDNVEVLQRRYDGVPCVVLNCFYNINTICTRKVCGITPLSFDEYAPQYFQEVVCKKAKLF
jgi:hypothetical protein